MRAWAPLAAGLLPLALFGCGDGTPNREAAAELRRTWESMSPERNPYLNARRVELIRGLPEPSEPRERLAREGRLAEELLYAGETEEAIARFEGLEEALATVDPEAWPEIDELRAELDGLLGLAWLRLGEQENCLANPAATSCVVPIGEEGRHRIETGSRNAIRYYTRIVERDPDDLNARWLLNFAYMTLGEYPRAVPDEWLIPEDAFRSEHDMGRFWDIAPHLGVDVSGLSGGAIVEDFTGNGRLDIMTSSWHLTHPLRFFANNGDGTFTDVTDRAGLTGITGGLNLKQADFTRNGHPDVLVLRGAWMGEDGLHPNSLLRNEGDGTFTDVTVRAGVGSRRPTQTAVWADFDGDGWIDLYIGNETTGPDEHPAELYLNRGDGTFREVAREAGVAAVGFIKGVDAGDIDNDGRQDLYVSRLGEPNLLFRNDGVGEDGIPTFTEVSEEAGVREPLHSFPVWFWDYDHDGWLDLFVSGYRIDPDDVAAEYLGREIRGTLPRLYRNEGDGTFSDVTEEKGLDRVLYTMGSNFGDFDNDGWLDMLVGTGDPDLRSVMPNRAFRGVGEGPFREVTAAAGFGNVQKGHAVAFGDVNGNGLQDVYMNLGGALEGDVFRNAFYMNPGSGNDWITLRFRGTDSDRSGIGTRIRVSVEDPDGSTRTLHRVVGSGGSFGGNSLQQEIGLGEARTVREIEVFWPASGIRQTFQDVQTNRVYLVREDAERLTAVDVAPFSYPLEGTGAHGH